MKISVVVATYDRRESLRRCLKAISAQVPVAHEIIVVDDASNDGTGAMVRQEFPDIRYIRMEKNGGPAKARNRGILAARGDIVAFTDDDCVPPQSWLHQLAAGFGGDKSIVGVGGYQEASPEVVRNNDVAQADRMLRLTRWATRDQTPQRGGYEIPGLGTNNVAYRRNALLEVGGFDESFPVASGEDADLKLRVSRRGGDLLYIPMAVWHHRPYTMSYQWQLARRRGIGAYYFERKHEAAPSLVRIFARCLKRTILFLRDLVQLPFRIAFIMYFTRLGDCLGQLEMALEVQRE